MPTKTTKPSAKELQKEARGLGIEGYEDMGLKELREAVSNAQNGSATSAKSKPKSKTKKKIAPVEDEAPVAKKVSRKAVAKKKVPAAKKADSNGARHSAGLGITKDSDRVLMPPSGVAFATEKVNPFRKGSNLAQVAPLLFKGGKRQTLAEKLSEKIELRPYHRDIASMDILDYDKRVLLCAKTMRDKFGFGIIRSGRGMDGIVKVFVPGSSDDPTTKTEKPKGKKKAAK